MEHQRSFQQSRKQKLKNDRTIWRYCTFRHDFGELFIFCTVIARILLYIAFAILALFRFNHFHVFIFNTVFLYFVDP